MTVLLLDEREQAAVRAVIAADPLRVQGQPALGLLPLLTRLIACDSSGIAVLDVSGSVSHDVERPRSLMAGDRGPPLDGPLLGIHRRRHAPPQVDSSAARGLAVLSLGVRNGPEHVVTLWMVRRTTDFSGRDCAALALVAPALERLLHQIPGTGLPRPLTAQEVRVLRHVAEGLSSVEIAERLVIAPCTVHKHLENAYRKLGVTNRMAAVLALQATG
jgi:DNA-binding CsgD family transcriptional regulator